MEIVNTKSGLIRGSLNNGLFGQEYWSYEGIPYAQPPIGELRFRVPEAVIPWAGVLEASAQGPACCSIDAAFEGILGDENCLHLNVYVNKSFVNDTNKLLPVLVFLHGGAFMYGSSGKDLYGPDYFMTQPLVLVTLNYRLGAFGFLTLDDSHHNVPGNAGLKDQRMALEWIQQNISAFQGDPSNVTLCGESAGAASVHYHMLSSNSKNLFHRVILMSGCVLNPWALIDRSLNMGHRLATRLGWRPEMDKDIVSFLQQASAEDITREQNYLLTEEEKMKHILFPFGPVVEPFVADDCVIPTTPLTMCENDKAWAYVAKIPVLVLGTSDEGLYLRKEIVGKGKLDSLDYIKRLVPHQTAAESFKEFYFASSEISEKSITSFIDFMSDKWFWHGLHRTMMGRIKKPRGATFLIRFNADLGDFNHFKTLMCGKGVKGTCHVDNCSYLFRHKGVAHIPDGSKELELISTMVDIFKVFAESGTVSWSALEENSYKCLNINEEGVSLIDLPERPRMEFWDTFYEHSSIC